MDKALNTAIGAAMREAADRAILPRFVPGTVVDAHFKAPGEAVTAADREAEEILHDRLRALSPDIPIVGEEASHENPDIRQSLAAPECWIIDPLCGRFCAAQAGGGTQFDGKAPESASAPSAKPTVCIASLFNDSAVRSQACDALSREFNVIDAPRCAAHLYPAIAEGTFDAAVFTRTICWDHAAGVLLVEEAGGRAARQDASSYRCDSAEGGLVDCRSMDLWDRVTQILFEAGVDLSQAGPPSL